MDILITGAASGIGRAAALAFAKDARMRGEAAPHLLLVDLNADKLKQTADLLSGSAEVVTEVADLSQPDEAARLVGRAVSAFGGLDVLVSNAGIGVPGALRTLSLVDYERTFAVNTRAALLLGQAAFPHLSKRKGAIIATASIAATAPTPVLGVYSASKAALISMMKQMALEWGAYGIRCNTVSPGPTHTGMTPQYAEPDIRGARERAIPVGRVGAPEDIANAIVFLARPESSYISGVDIAVDGGLLTTLMLGPGFHPEKMGEGSSR